MFRRLRKAIYNGKLVAELAAQELDAYRAYTATLDLPMRATEVQFMQLQKLASGEEFEIALFADLGRPEEERFIEDDAEGNIRKLLASLC